HRQMACKMNKPMNLRQHLWHQSPNSDLAYYKHKQEGNLKLQGLSLLGKYYCQEHRRRMFLLHLVDLKCYRLNHFYNKLNNKGGTLQLRVVMIQQQSIYTLQRIYQDQKHTYPKKDLKYLEQVGAK